MKIIFLIRSLVRGGAERQLTILARGLAARGHDVTVVVFYPGGHFQDELAESPVEVVSLEKRGRWRNVVPYFRFLRLLRARQPDVVHGYMDVANVACLGAALVARRATVVWGIRSSAMDLGEYGWLRRLAFRTETVLSRFPDLIIANSEAGRHHRVELGFPGERTMAIPNGIDTERFRPDGTSGERIRESLDLPEEPWIIGHVGRMDPKKDHETLLRAMSLLGSDELEWRLVCVGGGNPKRRHELSALASRLGIAERVQWCGFEDDMRAVYNAFDFLVSSSAFGEGFPNVIGEAMACGTPCVVTDVGDSARIVGETGVVVPTRYPGRLAEGIRTMVESIEDGQSQLGQQARSRIVNEFNVELLVDRTIDAVTGG